MSWRYMAAVETIDGEEVWTIREFYDGGGWTARAVAPTGSTHDELREVLRMMAFDIEHRDFLDLDAGAVAHRPGGLRADLSRPGDGPLLPVLDAADDLLACQASARGYREAAERLGAERDDLLAIIDDARHALAADGPKLEPARQVLARALPQTTAWQDRTRHARDITPPHVIAHRGAQLDAVTAERDALAEKVEDLECVLAGAGFCVECYANGRHKLDCSRRRTASALDGEASHE